MNRSNRSNRINRKGKIRDVPVSALSYRGPVRDAETDRDEHKIDVVMHVGFTVTTNGSGQIFTVAAVNPSAVFTATEAQGWTALAALYDEYRVLGLELEWITKYYPDSSDAPGGAQLIGPLYSVVDKADGTALTTVASAFEYESCHAHPLWGPGSNWKREWRMSGAEEAAFVSTSAPATIGSIKLAATSLTASIDYGVLFATLLVQFRGRK